jgi:hypothetical protein
VDAEGGDAASEEQKEAVQFMAVQTEVLKAQKEVGEKLGFTGDEGCASPSNCVATTRLLLHTNTHTHTHTHTHHMHIFVVWLCSFGHEGNVVVLLQFSRTLCLRECTDIDGRRVLVDRHFFCLFFSYSFASTCWQVHQDASIAYGAWNG